MSVTVIGVLIFRFNIWSKFAWLTLIIGNKMTTVKYTSLCHQILLQSTSTTNLHSSYVNRINLSKQAGLFRVNRQDGILLEIVFSPRHHVSLTELSYCCYGRMGGSLIVLFTSLPPPPPQHYQTSHMQHPMLTRSPGKMLSDHLCPGRQALRQWVIVI